MPICDISQMVASGNPSTVKKLSLDEAPVAMLAMDSMMAARWVGIGLFSVSGKVTVCVSGSGVSDSDTAESFF